VVGYKISSFDFAKLSTEHFKGGTVQLKPIEEQIVVLMGSSSGIGRETALRFGRRGARVLVSARNEEGLNSLVGEIRAEAGEAIALPAEVTKITQVKAVADGAAKEYGWLDT
jgi:NAD(P)-dependent dehydrogenase (short-subunit alcohol dehydrogenase family)